MASIEQQKPENKNGNKTISTDKQVKSHTRRLGHGYEREILREKLYPLDSSSKHRHKDDLFRSNNRKNATKRRCRSCGDRDETVNYIITKCRE